MTQLALDTAGVHEIKPALQKYTGKSGDWAASWSAAQAFALTLMARRIACSGSAPSGCKILYCLPHAAKTEHGTPYIHGLQHLGFTVGNILLAETRNARETLWALEEGLKSESLALVAGFMDDVALTPARRLALAAQKHNTPCLLLTHPCMPPAGATATRWRVRARLSVPHVLNGQLKAPGARRFAVTLERDRATPSHVTGQEIVVEWSNETLCLHLVASLSDRSSAPRQARIGATR